MHVLCRLCSRSPNDLTRLPNALSTTALHPRPLPIVLNSSKQSATVGDTSTKFTDLSGPSKTHPRSFRTSLRLHKTSPDHPGRKGRLSSRLSVMLKSSWSKYLIMMTSSNGNISALLVICAGNSPHKTQWRGALMFYLICVWINGWVNNGESGDLRSYRAHCDVRIMLKSEGKADTNSWSIASILAPKHL